MGPCCQSTWGGTAPCPGVRCQTVQRPPGLDVRPVPSGVAVQDGLVARRLQHQCFPLLGPERGCAATRVPDAAALAECGMPRVGRVALRPLYATRHLRLAVVVDKTLPAVRQ